MDSIIKSQYLTVNHYLQAEEVNIKGRVYHKKCMTCGNCKRAIDISILAIGQDDDIYCKICCHKISWPGRLVLALAQLIIEKT